MRQSAEMRNLRQNPRHAARSSPRAESEHVTLFKGNAPSRALRYFTTVGNVGIQPQQSQGRIISGRKHHAV